MNNSTVFCSYDFCDPENIQPDLNNFLSNFDPASKEFDCEGFSLSSTSKAEAIRYSQNRYFGNLTKSKYSSIRDNLSLVYGDNYVTEKDVLSFHLTEAKIVQEYLSIQNLDRLFDEDFFNFEWDIHTQQDFIEHRPGYQRDHFIHQIRNLWMMDELLENYGFYKASKAVLQNAHTSPISRYVSIKCEQALQDLDFSFDQLVDKIANDNSKAKSDYVLEHFYKFVIYGSAYLSALFHDLGYPVVHFLNARHRLSEYSPASYMFTHNSSESFDMLANKLNDSLLFTIESAKNIRRSMEPDEFGKYDHGVYSAIPFLLHFYESGLIYKLSPERACAIELAAVAIYNHNLPLFSCTEKSMDKEYYKPYFSQNPTAFLLKTCDDLQEWDRRYFEITNASNLAFCPFCHKPLMKTPVANPGRTHRRGIDEPSPRRFIYVCGCNKQHKYITNEAKGTWDCEYPHRQENFLKRKILLIRACDKVVFEKVYKDTNSSNGSYILKATINYDLYKLLELSRFSFAKYRINEMIKLKKKLSYQNYRLQSGENSAPDAIFVDYFLSSNPITIKVKILEKYLLKKYSFNGYNCQRSYLLKIVNDVKKSFSKINDSVKWYADILFYCYKCKNNKSINSSVNRIMNTFERNPFNKINSIFSQYTRLLVENCLTQYSQESSDVYSYECIYNYMCDGNYENLYSGDDNSYDVIMKYCYSDAAFNSAESNQQSWNYYHDLYIFFKMNEYINQQP